MNPPTLVLALSLIINTETNHRGSRQPPAPLLLVYEIENGTYETEHILAITYTLL